MRVFFVAETSSDIDNAGEVTRIEAKSLTGAKIKATKLWKGNPYITSTGATMLIVGDHIDVSGRIDHVLSTKNGQYYGTEPRWFDNDLWVSLEADKVEEESHDIPELSIGDTVKVTGDKFERGNDLIGLTGVIYDVMEDEGGLYYTVEFEQPVHHCLHWDFMPQDLEVIKEEEEEESIMGKAEIRDKVVILESNHGAPEETVGQIGVITDIFEDPEGTFCTVKFNQQFHGWSRWDYKLDEIALHVAEGGSLL